MLDVFDAVQEELTGAAISYLMANLTRWTTHSIAFFRLLRLKAPLRQAAILRRTDIIDSQVSAEKNKKKCKKMEDKANGVCDLLDDPTFWKDLQVVSDDIEPICYITNINLGEKTRANQVLLGFAGRIEKRWAAMDQDFFVMALVLNPYERTSRFGDQAGVSVFAMRASFMTLYCHIKSRPVAGPLTVEQDAQKKANEAAVSQAFPKYIGGVGVFANFESNHEEFEKPHGDDPILVLRNRLSFQKTGKMSKVGSSIRSEHVEAGFIDPRQKRKNHDESRVASLIAVPQYADLLENEESDDEAEERTSSRLVNSQGAWRKLYTSWVVAARLAEIAAEEDGEPAAISEPSAPSARPSNWLPCPLSRLFGGNITKPLSQRPRRAYTREELCDWLTMTTTGIKIYQVSE
ncbi:hypothetical protein C8J57DRAFT_1529466 [Mycena rebaudengoi]|nr:hypothetical protein C8J57DRAFT_1529466 [Mycena rebaudengoi]